MKAALAGLLLTLAAIPPAHGDARDGILALYRNGCNAVALPEPHGEILAANFREDLVRHPGFAGTVDTIAVEFASAFHQDLLDRWVLDGEDLPLEQVRSIWQDTMQMFVWDAPIYERFLRTVREANMARSDDERVRVLALAPAIDWQNVSDHSEIRPLMERGRLMPQRVYEEAISRGENVLIIVGSAHYIRRNYRGGSGSGSAYLDHRMDGRLCVLGQVDTHDDRATQFADQYGFDPDQTRLIFPLAGSGLEHEDASEILGLVASGRLEQGVDGLLFLGTDPAQSFPPAEVFTEAYTAEWRRRVPLLWPRIDPAIVDGTISAMTQPDE